MASFFRNLLSYIIELPVEKVTSNLSGDVTVSLHRGQYKLSTRDAIYSFGSHYTSFAKAFQALNIRDFPAGDVLVLGAGLGSVVDLLEENKTIEAITAVDADEVIIGLSRKYLHSPLSVKVRYVCSDAAIFVENNKHCYDLVLFDVFVHDATPPQFMEPLFLKNLKACVQKNGMLLFSRIDVSHSDELENNLFAKTFRAVFPSAFSIDTNGNKIFLWRQG